jgi:hypothetical protein
MHFGETLFNKFFGPFHERYVAGLHRNIAPQDPYKSPLSIEQVRAGATCSSGTAGYNTTFAYPEEGLDTLARNMANECDIRYAKTIVRIDINRRTLHLADGTTLPYETVLSTLPLNVVAGMVGLQSRHVVDPFTSVLVLNIGAERGRRCPDDHWLYTPDAKTPFHRVGFYSNVDSSFIPARASRSKERVGLYIERSFLPGEKPSEKDILLYSKNVIQELQSWQFIGQVEVMDPTWIDVAYTWSWPNSQWRQETIAKLQEYGIHQIGRYGKWEFQGIAESIREGYITGMAAGGKTTALKCKDTMKTTPPLTAHS